MASWQLLPSSVLSSLTNPGLVCLSLGLGPPRGCNRELKRRLARGRGARKIDPSLRTQEGVGVGSINVGVPSNLPTSGDAAKA